MQATIVSEIDGVLKKIVWLNEGSGGIYVGYYGKTGEIHHSYHVNGIIHVKSGKSYLPIANSIPISNIKGFVNIVVFGITLESGYGFVTDDYKGFARQDAVIYVNPDIIKRKRILNVHFYLIQEKKEKDFLDNIHNSFPTGQNFEVINANFFKLDHLKGFLAGLVLCGAS